MKYVAIGLVFFLSACSLFKSVDPSTSAQQYAGLLHVRVLIPCGKPLMKLPDGEGWTPELDDTMVPFTDDEKAAIRIGWCPVSMYDGHDRPGGATMEARTPYVSLKWTAGSSVGSTGQEIRSRTEIRMVDGAVEIVGKISDATTDVLKTGMQLIGPKIPLGTATPDEIKQHDQIKTELEKREGETDTND